MNNIVVVWDEEDDCKGNRASQKWKEAMSVKQVLRPKWTAADRVRHKLARKEFEHCPTQEDLQSSGDFEGPIKSGAYFAVKTLVHDLKQARKAAGLTLAAVAIRAGMEQTSLSQLENGRQPNPTVDTLWRYASAIGSQLVLSHTSEAPKSPTNGKAIKPKQRDGVSKKGA